MYDLDKFIDYSVFWSMERVVAEESKFEFIRFYLNFVLKL